MPTVLVVDDERCILDVLVAAFADERFAVRTASDGRGALDVQARWPSDVIISDVTMPVLDGLAMVTELRALGDRTPVILMSALGRPACTHEGVHGLSKPFDLDVVLDLVDHLVAGKDADFQGRAPGTPSAQRARGRREAREEPTHEPHR